MSVRLSKWGGGGGGGLQILPHGTLTLSMVVPTSSAHFCITSVLRRCVEVMPYSSKYLRSIARCSLVNVIGSGEGGE